MSLPDSKHGHLVSCDRCGKFSLSDEALHDAPAAIGGDEAKVVTLAHSVRKMQRNGNVPFLTSYMVDDLLRGSPPSIPDQVNNLVAWLGDNLKGPGEAMHIRPTTHQFVIGAKTPAGFSFIVDHLFESGLLAGDPRGLRGADGETQATLSFEGWRYYDSLVRGAVSSRKAFMAMQYGDADLDRVVNEVFRPAVAQTGFNLVRLDDRPHAGLIDDRMRIEIRTSRFLIADLSHGNRGSYWEAGYAEGLGKPVIYTCEREVFEREKTHFDTNHHLTVVWDRTDLAACAEQLKATIRTTLPDEAKLTDA